MTTSSWPSPPSRARTPLSVELSCKRFALVQGSVIAALLLASLFAYSLAALGGDEGLPDVLRLISVDGEGDFPTYWSALNLLLASALVLVIAESVRRDGGPHLWRWQLLVLGLATMSLDEFVQLHEYSGHFPAPIEEGGWVIYAVPLCVVIVIALAPLLVSLEGRTRRYFVAAGAVFLTGAVAFEGLGGLMLHYEIATRSDFIYDVRRLGEEGLEMAGVAILNVALLREILRRRISIALFHNADPATPSAPDQTGAV